jgi:uracil-DNA glycosylase
MIEDWDDLKFWDSEDWERIQGRLDKGNFNPKRTNLFKSLDLTPFDTVKCVLMGQDPYPDPKYATGVAFSIPKDVRGYPQTLTSILREYCTDLRLKRPANGNLEHWCREGVLLWNAYPSCEQWKSLSHYWDEWASLTKEIITELNERDVVFVFMGAKAKEFVPYASKSFVIETSHPSPRGSINSYHPFYGSRIFSRVNDILVQELGRSPIDWYLSEPKTKRELNVHHRIKGAEELQE